MQQLEFSHGIRAKDQRHLIHSYLPARALSRGDEISIIFLGHRRISHPQQKSVD